MKTLYLAKLDEDGFIKSVEQQDASHFSLLRPEESILITCMQYNILFENLGTGKKFKIVEGDIVSVETLSAIKQKYAHAVARLVESAKEKGILFNGLRFKLNAENMNLLALCYQGLNFKIKTSEDRLVALSFSEAHELRMAVAKAAIDIMTLEYDALKAITNSKCHEDVGRIFSALEDAIRCINECKWNIASPVV